MNGKKIMATNFLFQEKIIVITVKHSGISWINKDLFKPVAMFCPKKFTQKKIPSKTKTKADKIRGAQGKILNSLLFFFIWQLYHFLPKV